MPFYLYNQNNVIINNINSYQYYLAQNEMKMGGMKDAKRVTALMLNR